MYCPRCATENSNEASFCRACGADIRLVPQAMTGRLPTATGKEVAMSGGQLAPPMKSESPAKVEKAFEKIFLGAAFLLIFSMGLIFFRPAFMIWIWFIIPAFASIGSGVGQYLRYKEERRRQERLPSAPSMTFESARAVVGQTPAPELMPRGTPELAPRDTSEMFSFEMKTPPASVTEGTTRYLDVERTTPRSGDRDEENS